MSPLTSTDQSDLLVTHSEQEESIFIPCEDTEEEASCGRCPTRPTPASQDSVTTRLKVIVSLYPHNPPTPLPPKERQNHNAPQP